jgi:DNA-binding winged helix-turn-helix (wHTH) protein/Tol biopolymer transport system component
METLKEQTFTFADFELDAAKRLLLKQGKAVSLNSKTFDLLLTLVENRRQVLSKEDLLNKVWTDQFVEENNLTVQISALRKIFGEKKGEHQFIVTVPGKGYKFVADVQTPQGEKEIVIESHKFSRVLIEEDIVEKSENEIAAEKIISPRRRLEEHERQKAVSKISPFIFYSSLGVILTVLLAGIWFSDNGKTVEKKQFSIAKLTTNGKVSNATLTPDSKYAVFSQTEDAGESLWLRHIETGSQTQILPVKAVKYVGLTVSPEGNLIYATVFGGDMRDPQIWRVPLLGGAIEEIREIKTGASVSLSPDGRRFAFTESRGALKETHFGIADSNGANKQILVRAAYEQRSFPNFDLSPVAWSPDGSEIACIVEEKLSDGAKKSGILLINPSDGSERFISEKRWDFVAHLAWIDAETLAFTAYKTDPWQGQIWAVSRKSGETRQVTKELSSYTWLASAGEKLLTVQKTAISHIRVADFDEKTKALQTREIYNESGIISNVAWTADERVLYSSSASGKREIWRMQKDGTNAAQLTVNADVSFGMSVSPIDGSLVFCSTDNGKHALRIADSEGKNVRPLTDGTEDVFPNFTPDGQSVIFQRGLNNKTLWRYDFIDGKITQLTETLASYPTVSPDAALTAYYFLDREADNLWRVGLVSNETGAFSGKINLPAKITERRMRWHPSGRFLTQIFYTGEKANLFLLPTNGDTGQEISGFGKGDVNWFEWSPNGESIIVSQTETSQDIVLIEPSFD